MWLPDRLRIANRRQDHFCLVARDGLHVFAGSVHQSLEKLEWRFSQEFEASTPNIQHVESAFANLSYDCSQIRSLSFVFESYWCPMTMLQLGRSRLSEIEIESFARHRFKAYFGSAVDTWRIQCDETYGPATILVYALPPKLLACLNRFQTCHPHVKLSHAIPAFAYVLGKFSGTRSKGTLSSILFAEADRSIVALTSVEDESLLLHHAAPRIDHFEGLNECVKWAQERLAVPSQSSVEPSMSVGFTFHPHLLVNRNGLPMNLAQWQASPLREAM